MFSSREDQSEKPMARGEVQRSLLVGTYGEPCARAGRNSSARVKHADGIHSRGSIDNGSACVGESGFKTRHESDGPNTACGDG
jgi:hypothetical protein